MIVTFLLRIALNAVLLFLTVTVVPGIEFPDPGEVSVLTAVWLYARAGIAMALVNALVTPILKLLFFPLILITFGLASGLLNIIALWLLGVLLPNLVIESFLALIYGTLIMALGNVIINWINS